MSYIEGLFSVREKVVVVTGACGQLGRRFCEAFHEAGATVVGLDRKIVRHLPSVDYYDIDITEKPAVQEVFAEIFRKYGAVDVLVNNAGVSTFEPFEERTEEQFDWVTGVNLKGTFLCIQAYVNLFDRTNAGSGSIVNIGSIYGVVSPDYRIYTDCLRKNSEVYGATKAGIIQMTRYFAAHLAERGIRVNAVSPGGVYNPDNPQGEDFVKQYSFRCPMKRMARDNEMVGAVIYLAGNAASYTTGQNIVIDGGFSCW